jgi:hypothetical protein
MAIAVGLIVVSGRYLAMRVGIFDLGWVQYVASRRIPSCVLRSARE